MSSFEKQIRQAAPSTREIANRRWIYVPYDRFTDRAGPIAEQTAQETGIVIVESTAKAHRRLYHKKKLTLLISNMRHFALEQAERGVSVLYHFDDRSHGQALVDLQPKWKLPELTVMRPAERELRLDLAQAMRDGLRLREVPDITWLSTSEDFTGVFGSYQAGKSYVMDRFYRHMRQKTGILMQRGKPAGGKFSFDEENRKPFRRERAVPALPAFRPDAITEEVIDLVERLYGHHFGSLENFDLPVTQAQCDAYWIFARDHLLPFFGPYEDAMRDDEPQLFHSKCSALINLGRLLPRDLIRDVEQKAEGGAVPLASAEGFIRQLLGWREFMRHVHTETDGYRRIDAPKEHGHKSDSKEDPYAGARPSALDASRPLSGAYWGEVSGMHCLDAVVAQVIRDGWSHHITRLMVLSNLATLCGMSPRELTDWFWIAYVDAYDWVVEPNVLGMSTYGDGGVTATKPYVSGAAYIHRMSNYCESCQFDPKKSTGPGSCPFTALYWTFLERNEERLGKNFRLQMPYQSLRRKPAAELVQLRARADEAIQHLGKLPRPGY
ncbi:MAG TPA: cryptochrome/photolyase family protein [Acidobacteriaceae bacterium]